MPKRTAGRFAGEQVKRGESKNIFLRVSEQYTGDPITMPLQVMRAKRSGPTVGVVAVVHGDELNGMGIIHTLMFEDPPRLTAGTLILVPVLNIFGFDTQTRYMPDRRDLNRYFPGSESGSLTSRFACTIFSDIIQRCDYVVDLHTAAATRTNYPNTRGDLNNTDVRKLARAFGCELMIDGKGPVGSLRREATKAGCPTIALEAGEPFKIEPTVHEIGVRGVTNVLKMLGMLDGEQVRPAYQTRVNKAVWVRANAGGILRFHVSPGELVKEGQAVATNASVFGGEHDVLESPTDGIVLGMTTLPMVKPGEPVCHIAVPTRSMKSLRLHIDGAAPDTLGYRVREDLATNITVSEWEASTAR